MWWPVGTEMPVTWGLTATDTSSDKITTSGSVGLAGWVSITFYFDNFQVYPYTP